MLFTIEWKMNKASWDEAEYMLRAAADAMAKNTEIKFKKIEGGPVRMHLEMTVDIPGMLPSEAMDALDAVRRDPIVSKLAKEFDATRLKGSMTVPGHFDHEDD